MRVVEHSFLASGLHSDCLLPTWRSHRICVGGMLADLWELIRLRPPRTGFLRVRVVRDAGNTGEPTPLLIGVSKAKSAGWYPWSGWVVRAARTST
jgi:hypothetical protein